jgi:hypothetical protein
MSLNFNLHSALGPLMIVDKGQSQSSEQDRRKVKVQNRTDAKSKPQATTDAKSKPQATTDAQSKS